MKKSIIGTAAGAAMALRVNESRADFYEAREPSNQSWQGELQTRGEYNYNNDVNNILAVGLKGYSAPLYVATHFDSNMANGSLDELTFEAGSFSPPRDIKDVWSFLLTTRYTQDFNLQEDYFGLWLRTTALNGEEGFVVDAGVGYMQDIDGSTGLRRATDYMGLQATLGNHVGKHWLVGIEDVGELYRDDAYSIQIRSLVRYNTKEWALTGFTGVSQDNKHNEHGNLHAEVVYGLSLNVGGIVQRE